MDLRITSQSPSTGNVSEDPHVESQAPNPAKTDTDPVRRTTSPTPELIQAGEKAMAELGLTGPMASIQISPWWATCDSHPETNSREYYARAAFDHRSDAQRHTAKSQKYRDEKLETQQQLCALKALEAPMDQKFWGEFFG
ncbi:hypothetical protein V8F06_003451 [Rhypophila decipiens]